MATLEEYDTLDEEVKELIENYKIKKATIYEPCTLKNYKECLIGLHEELGLLNLNYIFNPYTDVIGNTLRPESLVNLINSIWMLLHNYKNLQQKVNKLEEENFIFENKNKNLNGLVDRLKEKINYEKNESKACVASAQRIADHSDEILKKLTEARAKLVQVTKQKEANDRKLHNEITRLKMQNEKLTDRIRDKDIHTHPTKASYGICKSIKSDQDEYINHLKRIIAKLEKNNQMLVEEVLDLKKELILGGMEQFTLEDQD